MPAVDPALPGAQGAVRFPLGEPGQGPLHTLDFFCGGLGLRHGGRLDFGRLMYYKPEILKGET